jgi:glycosyltransferase involved in cell wall biosynthesis
MESLLRNKTKVIGIPFEYSNDWIGGIYYIYNSVNSLSRVKNINFRIEFLIKNLGDIEQLKSNIYIENWGYRYIMANSINGFDKLFYKLFKKKARIFNKIDYLYLFHNKLIFNYFPEGKKIYWIGDLQNRFYPEYFDSISLQRRLFFQDFLAKNAKTILATSNTMKSEFLKFYPNTKVRIEIAQFSIAVPETRELKNFELDVLTKYNIKSKYYYSPNQFWAHKNHQTLILAFKKLVITFPDAVLVFTGKEFDSRNPDYIFEVKNLVKALDLNENILFLGFIPRLDQLKLIETAHAIIQPSLYEGWSTVIEDAKLLSKKVIVYDILVHREQLGEFGCYFIFENDLAELLIDNFIQSTEIIDYHYEEQISKTANDFLNCFLSLN